MGFLDKDTYQKEKAIRFCLVNNLIPFLEVNVQNYRELSDTATLITDIDVLGVKVDSTGQPKRVVFDCKTLGKTSPINRAFWASGLMNFAACSEAFIILKKKASEAHRLSAKQIDVHLFDDKQFDNYANSCSIDYNIDYAYSTDINNWAKQLNSVKGNDKLEQFLNFLNSDIPLETDCVRALRRFLSALQKIKGELDPAKPKHQSFFYCALSVFTYLMAQIVHDLRNIVDFDASEKTFEKLLKYYIWGGKNSFNHKKSMTELFSSQNEASTNSEPTLKEWPEFIELTRKLMDSPASIQECIHPIRELSFRAIVDKTSSKEINLSESINSNSRIFQFTYLMARYLVNSAQLPSDFTSMIDNAFAEIREL
ncbi:hypothetical protein [Thalassotalea euphylliae]|uniref:Uncharacterized protein n=1 Tax=Thalassotalea euphylliae TaxID=1655234 RepID=A0A3E0U1A5_9GAMM|nr:hypothetical protein [Thalassotalea euphylliae]REL30005.1 hypothetical protein DXX94_04390 [Thalassotalea euphylliae]